MKYLLSAGLLAAFLCAPLTFQAALAGPPTSAEDFTKRLMGREPGKGETIACFERLYDGAHLASHPLQNVRKMILMVSISPDNPVGYNLRIGVNFRNRKSLFETGGNCASPHAESESGGPYAAHCGVDCDGGSIDVALKDNGSVLLTIPDGARVSRPGAGEDDKVHGSFGSDDKLFRLDRADLRQCLPLANDNDEKALMIRGG